MYPDLAFILLLIVTALSVAAAIYLFMRLRQADEEKDNIRQKLRELESSTQMLQLQHIESRLNPHLFKNILNSIQSHAYQAHFALDKLANVLDYILYESRNKFVTPKEEIDFAMNLIEINKIKLSPLFELKVKTNIDEDDPLYLSKTIAPFISTDLIENAFKHADLQQADAFISIFFEFRDGIFYLAVSNKISRASSIRKTHAGFGVEALEQRLRIMYRDHFTLERLAEEDVYTAHLKINLRDYSDQMPAA